VQSVVHVPQKQKCALLAEWLEKTPRQRTLIFTRTKHGADKVVSKLNKAGIAADAIHGNKSQTARQQALARFKSERPVVLVATDIAARGLDVDDISHVVNFDMPLDPESYVHRIGRTGRAGADGAAISFCDGGERSRLRAIEQLTRQRIPATAMKLEHALEEKPRTGTASSNQPRQPQRQTESRPRKQPRNAGSTIPGSQPKKKKWRHRKFAGSGTA
jgi:ATP-dependent RNA helicase RhlE